MVDGQRVHRVVGQESDGVTRKQVEDYIEQIKTEARKGRLNLPKGRKKILRFDQSAELYLQKLKEEGGKEKDSGAEELEKLLDKVSKPSKIESLKMQHITVK